MICPSFADPKFLIIATDVPALLYYSHIPAIIISLLIGFFVFLKDRSSLAGRLLLFISLSFSLWTFFSLITWTNNNSELIMLVWSFFGALYVLLCILSLYFVYVFIDKRDVSFKIKIILGLIFLPAIILVSTAFNIFNFNLTLCGVTNEGVYYTNYYYGVGFLMFLWILFLLIARYRKAEKEMKKQIILLGFGIEFFLLSFFASGYIASLLTENSYDLEFYGLFGMTFFMAVLAFLIVKYKAFEIKLIGAQALVVSLIILVGSQFFFAKNQTSIILTGVTMALSLGFGYYLIRSVKHEVERKEELQLMADKLAQANDALRKLDNAKTEFISIASHQLRTPITAIKGFASLLLEGAYGELSEGVHGALEKVYSSSERLVSLIEDLLNVSRIESGRMVFAFEKATVEKLIKELYDNFILIAKTKKFYLDLKLPETPLPEVMMDYSKIRELVSNFIDNALKYTEKGGVTVKAELRDEGVVIDESGFVIEGKKSEFGKVVRVTVSDTGIGIPREEIPYLFKKFSRGKDVSRLHVGGTGLGLYVGKAIAENHHGAVWIESEGADKGSRFIIEIPVEHVG
ncbi:MAG: hypothetical protein HGA36_02310 [Candidatus Moranbacteria bacterium]|nr:hypothetical protein [Candidatus Moranbacteria bacterium]